MSLSGGFVGRVEITGEERAAHEYWVAGVPCWADEAHMGGIVLEPLPLHLSPDGRFVWDGHAWRVASSDHHWFWTGTSWARLVTPVPAPPRVPVGVSDHDHQSQTVTLRRENKDHQTRTLTAALDTNGNLVLHGHDLGSLTRLVSDSGEYEWFRTIATADLERLRRCLEIRPDQDLLDALCRAWAGDRSHELERIIRESDIPSTLSTWP